MFVEMEESELALYKMATSLFKVTRFVTSSSTKIT